MVDKVKMNCWMDSSDLEQIEILHHDEATTVYRLGQLVSVCNNKTGEEMYEYRLSTTSSHQHLHFDTLTVGIIILCIIGIVGIGFAMFHKNEPWRGDY